MKRKLDSKYEDLVNYVTDHQGKLYLSTIIEDFKSGSSKFMQIIDDLNTDYYSYLEKLDELIPIITDIYNDNYEIEEPEYYWKFNELKGFNKCDLYFGITLDTELLLIDVATRGTAKKCTKSELNDYLLDTNLTTDNFTPTEVLNWWLIQS